MQMRENLDSGDGVRHAELREEGEMRRAPTGWEMGTASRRARCRAPRRSEAR